MHFVFTFVTLCCIQHFKTGTTFPAQLILFFYLANSSLTVSKCPAN